MNYLVDLERLTPGERQILAQQLMSLQIGDVKKELEEVKRDLFQTQEKLAIAQTEISEEVEKAKTMAATTQRLKEPKFGWVNQGDFGRFLNPSIGSKTMGKFLKAVGLAMATKGQTTPYRKYIGRYADVIAHENFTQTRWNYENCMSYIDEWLKEAGLYEHFYTLETRKEVEDFINAL